MTDTPAPVPASDHASAGQQPSIAERGGVMEAFVYGKYRNQVGAEINIIGTAAGYINGTQLLGTVYIAQQDDALFGTHRIYVTPEGLIDCGYERVEE